MAQPIAFLNNQWIPRHELSISPTDAGFMLGITVAEQLRTFSGKIFRVDQHLDRLEESLKGLGFALPISRERLTEVVHEIVEINFPLIPSGSDLGIAIFVTPGELATYETNQQESVIGVHTKEVSFRSFAHLYHEGQPLVIPQARQTPIECWPRELKIRSRAHYYLADLQAKKIDPQSRAIMLDLADNVMEATTANIIAYKEGEGLISPPQALILPGISLAMLNQLANQLDIPFTYRNIPREELETMDELLLTSTSPCVLPCINVDQSLVGTGKPGPIFERLISAWSDSVGLDIRAQALAQIS